VPIVRGAPRGARQPRVAIRHGPRRSLPAWSRGGPRAPWPRMVLHDSTRKRMYRRLWVLPKGSVAARQEPDSCAFFARQQEGCRVARPRPLAAGARSGRLRRTRGPAGGRHGGPVRRGHDSATGESPAAEIGPHTATWCVVCDRIIRNPGIRPWPASMGRPGGLGIVPQRATWTAGVAPFSLDTAAARVYRADTWPGRARRGRARQGKVCI